MRYFIKFWTEARLEARTIWSARQVGQPTNHWLIACNPNHVERLNVTRMVARRRRCGVQIPDALGVVNLGNPSPLLRRVSEIREQLQCESSFA